MNNRVRKPAKRIVEEFDFEKAKNNSVSKNKNIKNAARKAVEDYKDQLINLNKYQGFCHSYCDKLKDLYLTLGNTFKGMGYNTDTKVDVDGIAKNLMEYWQGKTRMSPRDINGTILYYLYSDGMGLGFDYFLDDTFSDETHAYVIKQMSDDDNSGMYELVYHALDWAEFN